MKVFREFGQMPATAGISTKALLELTRAPDPQAALEEANTRREAGEGLRAWQ